MRILLADDHKMAREGLQLLLAQFESLKVVGTTDTGEEAWKEAQNLHPDVVVMDVSPTERDGTLSAVQSMCRIKLDCPSIKILALSAYQDEGHVRQALESGATGFLLKKRSPREFLDALRIVGSGGAYIDAAVTSIISGRYVNPITGAAVQFGLTDRQQELIKYVALGYTNIEIAQKMQISVKTVEGHKLKIGRKLGLPTRAEMMRYVLRRGWLYES